MNKKVEKSLKDQNGNYIFPFLWMHGETEEVLREYMEVIYKSNIRAVCVESRPHPDFCGEGWWRDMDIILDEARKKGMQVWILDDSHFPTGFANGAMEKQPDTLCRQSICCRIYEPQEGETLRLGRTEVLHPDEFQKTMIENYTMKDDNRRFEDDSLLALYAVRLGREEDGFLDAGSRIDLKARLRDGELEWEVPDGSWKVYALHLSRNQGYHRSYINMMDRASCRVLLDAVYEPHYAHYKEDFGTTIAGFFSDEPELGNGHMYEMDDPFGKPNDYPWSRELEERMKQRLGESCGLMLALLWENGADAETTAKVRYAYMDAVTALVREDFSMQVGTWCRERGVKYIGHLIEDNNHHSRTGSSLGHYFRGLAGQDMAGIDDIGGQVFPQGEDVSYNNGVFQCRNGEFYHYMLGKLGSSAAAIEPLKNGDSMCEIFGNYGWQEGVRLEKYLADHFLVRGINHYVPHAFSPKEFPDPDCPPHFYAHGHNPQYRHFGSLMAYMNRVCGLISGGRHVSPAAVLYDAEGDWSGNGEQGLRYMAADKVGHVLADAQLEYDVIPQDVFADRETYHTRISGGLLKVHRQEYRAVIVPYTQYVTEAFAKAVAELADAGIPVLFVDGYPQGICDTGIECKESGSQLVRQMREKAAVAGLDALAEELKGRGIAEVKLDPENNRIRYCRYLHEDGDEVYLFVNEGTKTWRGMAELPAAGDASVYLYDAWENRIEALGIENGAVRMEIEPLKSKIIVFDRTASAEEIRNVEKSAIYGMKEREETAFTGNWKRSICTGIAYPVFWEEKEIVLPDALEEEEPWFSGIARYENTFLAREGERMFLEITDAYEGVEVFVNGESLGIQIVPVFRYDLSPAIKDGENRIRIEVATTLERQMAKIPDRFGQTVEAKALSGIKGEVKLWKVGER